MSHLDMSQTFGAYVYNSLSIGCWYKGNDHVISDNQILIKSPILKIYKVRIHLHFDFIYNGSKS